MNAGNNPPCLLLCAPDRSIEELSAGGTVIGLFPQSSYEESTVDLHPGDVLIAFTDGLPDVLNPKHEEFGDERLQNLLRRVSDLEVNEIVSRIASELKIWIHDAEQFDDLTFIVMKVA